MPGGEETTDGCDRVDLIPVFSLSRKAKAIILLYFSDIEGKRPSFCL
jgi:hypothetical protein